MKMLYQVVLLSLYFTETNAVLKQGFIPQRQNVPYHVMIYFNYLREPSKDKSCGGTLIANQVVLTAGHCMNELICELPSNSNSEMECLVLAGTVYNPYEFLNEPDFQDRYAASIQTANIVEYVLHPDFDVKNFIQSGNESYEQATIKYDFALARLERPFLVDNFTRPIWLTRDRIDYNWQYLLCGTGKIDRDHFNGKVIICRLTELMQYDYCQKLGEYQHYRRYETLGEESATFCTFRVGCHGDSGGGLTYNYKIYGLMSSGQATCLADDKQYEIVPHIFANVPQVVDWILDTGRKWGAQGGNFSV